MLMSARLDLTVATQTLLASTQLAATSADAQKAFSELQAAGLLASPEACSEAKKFLDPVEASLPPQHAVRKRARMSCRQSEQAAPSAAKPTFDAQTTLA